jgi:UDP-N-acetylmuramoyl-tripeptide--D-alanyl-D-alanine ligase
MKLLYDKFLACKQNITTDTRKITKGCIYFALKGEKFDGNIFAEEALEQGAAYVVVDNTSVVKNDKYILVDGVLSALQQLANHHRKQLRIPVIGITGSNGKTTTKELIHAVLSKKYNTQYTQGNLNNHIGVPLTLLTITPQHEMAVVEMGANHQLEIDMLCRISEPNFGIITNIGKAHLEGFGGIEGVKKGKSELYKYLK